MLKVIPAISVDDMSMAPPGSTLHSDPVVLIWVWMVHEMHVLYTVLRSWPAHIFEKQRLWWWPACFTLCMHSGQAQDKRFLLWLHCGDHSLHFCCREGISFVTLSPVPSRTHVYHWNRLFSYRPTCCQAPPWHRLRKKSWRRPWWSACSFLWQM